MLVLRGGEDGAPLVRVLPITHTTPTNAADALEIPSMTKRRLGLDSERSWIVFTEANAFVWPGPDLRPAVNGDLSSIVYGMLPPRFLAAVKDKVLRIYRQRRMHGVTRTE